MHRYIVRVPANVMCVIDMREYYDCSFAMCEY